MPFPGSMPPMGMGPPPSMMYSMPSMGMVPPGSMMAGMPPMASMPPQYYASMPPGSMPQAVGVMNTFGTMPQQKTEGGEEIVLPSMFGSVPMRSKKSWGITGSKVVPTEQTSMRWLPEEHLHPCAMPEEAAVKYHPDRNSDLQRQKLARDIWKTQEEELTRRVTMLENLIRRTVDLPTFDHAGIEKKKKRNETGEYESDDAAHRTPFASLNEGPVYGARDSQVTDPSLDIYYVDPARARMQADMDYLMAGESMRWRARNPVTMALSGNYQYLGRALYLDEIDEMEMFYNSNMPAGVTLGPHGGVFPRMP